MSSIKQRCISDKLSQYSQWQNFASVPARERTGLATHKTIQKLPKYGGSVSFKYKDLRVASLRPKRDTYL